MTELLQNPEGIKVFEERFSRNKIKNYLQPLRYEIDRKYLENAEVIGLYMSNQW